MHQPLADPPRPKLRAGLMDPDNPRQPQQRPGGGMSLTTVQMWVASVLAVSMLLHFSLAVALSAFLVDESRLDSQIVLLVIAGVTGMLAVFAGLAIHRQRLLSWWLLLGWLPTAVATYLLFGR